MANNSIQTRFTETVYATKQEVIHELKTPLIDTFWKMIVAYRSSYARQTGVYKIDRSPITYCLCPSIASKIDSGEEKIYGLSNKYNFLSEDGNDRFIYKQNAMISILNEIAKKNDIQVDENYLRMVLSNKIVNDDEKYDCLNRYIKATDIVKNALASDIDEDLLAALYQTLSGVEELVSLYRTSTYMSPANRVIIDRVYTEAPAGLIPGLMDDFLKVVNTDELPVVVKSALTYYFISYIKPFSDHNEEIAALLTKLIIAKSGAKDIAYCLDLEKLFVDLNEKVEKVCNEVQKNNDFTYFLDLYMKALDDSIDKETSRMNDLEALALKKEYYHDDFQEAKKSPVYEEQALQHEEVVEQYENIDVEPEPAPTAEPVKHEAKPQPKPVPVQVEPALSNEGSITGLAISSLPTVLDEKQATRLEEDLLESDPELKHSQAYFYARHCTMGKRYTINQFKKELGCAYETARTSMDALASLGYYRQEMVKNKKVYTPIKRK